MNLAVATGFIMLAAFVVIILNGGSVPLPL